MRKDTRTDGSVDCTGRASKPGPAAVVAGLVIWLDAVLAALVLRADEARVYVLGHPIGWVCALRSQLHLPCPTCGITRSIVLSLHGELGRAWHIAPAGPVALIGLLAFATALLAARFRPQTQSWIRRCALAYSSIVLTVWIGGWARSFAAAWQARP